MADVLLKHGVDINQLSHGRTILMNFARQKYTNMIKVQQQLLIEVIAYLMKNGADAANIHCPRTEKSTIDFA